MKQIISGILCLIAGFIYAQDQQALRVTKTVAVSDTIVIDSVSINAKNFKLIDRLGKPIDSSLYVVDYSKALLQFKTPIASDSVTIEYLKYPDFLTRKYRRLDEAIIVDNTSTAQQLYKIKQPNTKNTFRPFDGLTTSGSISRGVSIGNNQNSVLNSQLDLQITGKLSDKVSLRASIQDANIPLQESGYSQRLDEFDQVFVELFSDRWKIRAGDIDLQDTQSYFAAFNKRVQGLNIDINFGPDERKTNVFASGALVRGQFTTSQFQAQEGNQGPYKLRGPNGELFVLIVSGSETVFVNGVRLKRGENNDYIIDYNAGEIIFNATFPITSDMRITVDYQYTERNYSRLVVYGGGNYNTEKFKLRASVYSESDSKNNPLQQNLSNDQVSILAQAGDDATQMVAPSATPEVYNENRILYKKEIINGVEAFVFSNNPEDQLFSVNFSLVAQGEGDYILVNSQAISNIYEYVPPVNGVSQGNYAPIVQLVAPTRLQLAVVNGYYTPTEKTNIAFEAAGSKNDLNLFSGVDDGNNDGYALKLKAEQHLIKTDSSWNLKAQIDTDYVDENFRNIQGLYNPEFNRDWNLEQAPSGTQIVTKNFGNQALVRSGFALGHHKKGQANYSFEHLNFSENFNGNRHTLSANFNLNAFDIASTSSYLTTNATTSTSTFFRTYNRLVYRLKRMWVGGIVGMEDNTQTEKVSAQLTDLSQRYKSYKAFVGRGDSTAIYAEIGYKYRVNDSVVDNRLQKVNTSNTYYLRSQLIKSTATNLALFVNYRTLKYNDNTKTNDKSLNSRLLYNQRLFDNLLLFNSVYETNSGSLPRQDFTYVEVEPGQGAYTWIDYNGNGVQELEEFEIAQFQDQGTYIRVLLPNQVFLKTHQNRLSLSLTINPIRWSSQKSKGLSTLSKFHNQTSYLIDRKVRRDGNTFDLNPFKTNIDNPLALQLNFRNVLFFNRGKQRYTTSYTYLDNSTKSELTFGIIENKLQSHQLNFTHKFATNWLFNMQSTVEENESRNKNLDGTQDAFVNRNFKVDELRFNPKLSYLLGQNTRFDVFYQYANKDNTIGGLESLKQQKYGVSFAFAGKKNNAINGEFNYFTNAFNGNPNSPVGYEMMNGLQPGKNFTWTLIAQKKLTKYLDLNLNYFGRKTETSKTIHSGNIQLKAYF